MIPRTDSLVSASDALAELYGSDDKMFGAHFLTRPNVRIDVDTVAALERYGVSPADSASVLMRHFDAPRTNLRNLGSGMTLSRTLSLDMIARSLSDGWKRPFYFACTVPSSYYLGLSPYLSATGMAYEVTPFRDAPVNVNALKSYENAFTKFRWGGLDAPDAAGLYLDETVRRMVASTRSALFTTAEDLLLQPDAPASYFAKTYASDHGLEVPATQRDMARNLLELILEKLPAAASPWDGMMDVYIACKYYDMWLDTGRASDLERARGLLDAAEERYAQLVRYASSLTPSRRASLGRNEDAALQYLGMVVGMQNQMDVVEKLRNMPERTPEQQQLLDAVGERLPMEYALRVFPLLYVDGYSVDDLRKAAGAHADAEIGSLPPVALEGAMMLEAHKTAGVDPLARTKDIEDKYGVDRADWSRII